MPFFSSLSLLTPYLQLLLYSVATPNVFLPGRILPVEQTSLVLCEQHNHFTLTHKNTHTHTLVHYQQIYSTAVESHQTLIFILNSIVQLDVKIRASTEKKEINSIKFEEKKTRNLCCEEFFFAFANERPRLNFVSVNGQQK